MADDEHDDPHDDPPADDLFVTAGRRPDAPEDTLEDNEIDDDIADADVVTSADSPYPDGAGGAGTDVATTGASRQVPYRPPRRGSFGYHAPPPSAPDGTGGYRAGPYPAGPPTAPQPQFGRRAPRQGPQPDADGYYPSDYYLGTDWTRVVIGGLITLTLGIAAVAAGLWLYDEFDPRDNDDEVVAEATPTPVELVPVFECAGDQTAVTEIPAPNVLLIAGRTADSRWLAFRNPAAPPVQLWVEAERVPDFDTSSVGVVSCATSPQEFPTPRVVGEAPSGPPPTSRPTPTPLPAP